MTEPTDVTAWCRGDLADLIRGFLREREGEPVTALEADELADRLCGRVGLEVRMHLERQAWLLRTVSERGRGSDRAADGPAASEADIPF